MDEDDDPVAVLAPPLPDPQGGAFSPLPLLPDIVDFHDHDDDDPDEDDDVEVRVDASALAPPCPPAAGAQDRRRPPRIDPEPHVSSQFYTFNRDSHALMARCILEGRVATAEEIRGATPSAVLRSWRAVWKDRNEDTAYLTAWKRIQDKLNACADPGGGGCLLYFKNNSSQYVSHVDQWQEIVTSFHGDADLRHLGLKETIDRIKQVWTVGAKFYGIPESFIRVCVSSCPVCNGDGQPGGAGGGGACSRTKRRRFEYTESFDVPARDVPNRLQQLAAKHKVVLCIRQKYIRYKPFMAEVKDYACHRAGEPSSATTSKKSRVLKREPYASKRCGCGFRIRAIVPITNYNEKDKSFVYQEEGTAVFKLYAVHTGHDPGPSDGNARIIHRVVGHKGMFEHDPLGYGFADDIESEPQFPLLAKEDADDTQLSIMQQLRDMRNELGILEGKVVKMPQGLLGMLSQELSLALHRIRTVCVNYFPEKVHNLGEDLSLENGELVHWEDRLRGGSDIAYDKDVELIEDEEPDFGHTLREDSVSWDRLRVDCRSRDILLREDCKGDKWSIKDCNGFDEKSILDCVEEEEDMKLIKPLRHVSMLGADSSLVGISMDGFYSDNKWYDSPSVLDPGENTVEGGF